jgi:hypothetical protein
MDRLQLMQASSELRYQVRFTKYYPLLSCQELVLVLQPWLFFTTFTDTEEGSRVREQYWRPLCT